MENKKQQKFRKQLQKKHLSTTTYEQEKLLQTNTEADFSVANLLAPIEGPTDRLVQNYVRIAKMAAVMQEPETRKEREGADRKVTAAVMLKGVKKWLPLIKKNREADRIDFTRQKNVATTRVSAISSVLQNNPVAQELEKTLKNARMDSERGVAQLEVEMMSKAGISEQDQKKLQGQIAHKVQFDYFY